MRGDSQARVKREKEVVESRRLRTIQVRERQPCPEATVRFGG